MGGSGPPMMNAGYNANYQIVQSPGYVMILTEMIHDARIIPLDNRPQPPPGVRQWTGVSRGRWEGNTLVVETTNFNGKNAVPGRQREPEGHRALHARGRRRIDYKFTVEDPATWDRDVERRSTLAKTEGPIFEFACHETNYGIPNILAGARAEEKTEGRTGEEGIELTCERSLPGGRLRRPVAGGWHRCGRIMRLRPSST